MKSLCLRHGLALVAFAAVTAAAAAQPEALSATTTTRTVQTKVEEPGRTTTETTTTTREKIVDTSKEAGKIASQPVRDVGAQKIDIPAPVAQAAAAPYSLKGAGSCAQLKRAILELNDVLGPDYAGGIVVRENKAGKIAAAGGKTIVNAIIPFRGLVREVSGAAPAERRLNAAIRAAYARRGFLRGVATARRCRLG